MTTPQPDSNPSPVGPTRPGAPKPGVDNAATEARAGAHPPPDDTASASLDRWPRFELTDWIIGVATLVAVTAVALPRLPPGICYGDSGELQLVAATLGITHAPGYPIYAALGWLFTLIPGLDPVYAVTLGCLLSGLVVIWLGYATQLRLRINAAVAGTLMLAFAAHDRTWINLIAPEVYAPTLAFQAGSLYLLLRYSRLHRSRDLYLAALFFGVACANRPPVLLSLPFLVAAWWLARRRIEGVTRRSYVGSIGLCIIWASVPGWFSLGYLYMRDAPETAYNYIEQHDAEYNQVPDLGTGVAAKIERVIWHASAREFDYAMGNDLKGAWTKLRWLRKEFFLYQPGTFVLSVALAAVGLVTLFRRDAITPLLLTGMIASTLVFLCVYRMWGQAADYLPLSWAVVVLIGASTTLVLRGRGMWLGQQIALAVWATMGALTVWGFFQRPSAALAGDAVPFMQQMDLATLPENAVVIVAWPETPVVFYARYVASPREDITVIAAAAVNWERMLRPFQGRPLFATTNDPRMTGFTADAYRNIWRLTPQRSATTH